MKLALIPIALFASPVLAEPVLTDCNDWRASAEYVAEPWDEMTATFGNGATRIAIMDSVEPANAAYNLLILSPPFAPTGERQCRLLTGFSGLSLEGMEAGYDPSIGLYLTLTSQLFLDDISEFASAQLDLRINQETGDIDYFIAPYFE